MRYIRGKSTRKQLTILVLLIILLDAGIALSSMIAMNRSFTASYILPIPLYPIAMLLLAKYVHEPMDDSSTDNRVIHVPFRTRVSSRLRHKKPNDEDLKSD